MTQKKVSAGKWAALAVGLICMFLTGIIAPPAGLSQAGFQVLGILVGAIILFLTWGTGFPSMMIVFALMTVDGLTAAKVTNATFGNNTAVFLVFCMMLAACLTKSGAARRIAIWFLTNKLSRKSPWWTVAMFLIANFILNYVLSSAATVFVMLPIAIEILEGVGLKKENHDPISVVLMLGFLVTALTANAGNPISHAVTIQGFSLYESYVGQQMDFFTFTAVTTPVSILSAVGVFLLVKYCWRPDVSLFSSINYDELQASCGPVTKRELASLGFYLVCVFFWLIPGLSKYAAPALYPALNKINNCFPPLLALFLMNLITIDGEKILDWSTALKAANWPSFLFIATIMGLGSFMGNADIGISQWLSDSLAPVFGGVSPLVFVTIMVVIVDVLTNFCSNSVALSVVFAVALPLCMNLYDGVLSPMLLSILITSCAMNGWATAPATPTAAVAYATGWGNTSHIMKWGFVFMMLQVVFCIVIGVPLAQLLCA